MQQAVQVEPSPYKQMVGGKRLPHQPIANAAVN
jgi:hypothetical protein